MTITLEHHQRLRLIRSTRKLGAVLGTTPFLIDPNYLPPLLPPQQPLPIGPKPKTPTSAHARSASEASSTKALRRQGQIYYSLSDPSSPDPSPSYDLFSPSRTFKPTKLKRNAPSPLLLSLNAVSVPYSDVRAGPDLPPSPIAPTYRISFLRPLDRHASLPVTPLTPTFVTNVPEARRRKMAKVTRTLGEKVPTELVFPASTSTHEALQSKKRPVPGVQVTTIDVSNLDDHPQHRRDSYPSGFPDYASSFLSLTPSPSQPFPSPSILPSSAFIVPSPSTSHPPPSASFVFVRTPSSDIDAYGEKTGSGAQSGWCPTPAMPASREWTGGWNRSDIQDVQKGLRALKGK